MAVLTLGIESGAHERVPEKQHCELEMGNMVTENTESIITENATTESRECIDDNKLVLKIRDMLEKSDTSSLYERCIYRVPEIVRKLNPAAYTPHVVSIGPYHHGNERLWPMEGFKRDCCNELISRSDKSLKDCIDHLKQHEKRARMCYEENINCRSREDFLAMLLVDGCFIIEILVKFYVDDFQDDIPSMQFSYINILHDMKLLENQLPLFILESLFVLLNPLSHITEFYFMVMNLFWTDNGHIPDFSSVNHFIDLIRLLHIKPVEKYCYVTPNWDPVYTEFIASALQLHDAGIKFKMVPGKCLLDINFENHYLELPSFELTDDNVSLFRNLMAFELCHYPDKTFIIDYFVFMDTLIDTANDISLLVQNGILLNRYGDYNGAARTFNNFCAGITHCPATSYLIPLHEKLNEHLKIPRYAWMATLKRDYFSTPFKITTTITAVSIVVLTLISTICSVIAIL